VSSTDRESLERMIELSAEVNDAIDRIRNDIYSTDEPYDENAILASLSSLESLVRNFDGLIGYTEEKILLKELESSEKEG